MRPRSHAAGAPGVEREDRERHAGIRAARRGIALLQDAHAVGIDLESLDFVDRRLVDARIGEVLLVGRPPVAGVAAHLLLRDELGDAMAHEPAAARGEPALGAGRDFDRVEVLVADEADVAAVRGELRVGLEGRASRSAGARPRPRASTGRSSRDRRRAERAGPGSRATTGSRRCRAVRRCAGARAGLPPRPRAFPRQGRGRASRRAGGGSCATRPRPTGRTPRARRRGRAGSSRACRPAKSASAAATGPGGPARRTGARSGDRPRAQA